MKKQSFQVTIKINAEVESAGQPYLTKTNVRQQIEKFLKCHHITDGLPCHGTAEIVVADIVES